MTDLPAILGGAPRFTEPIAFARPTIERPDLVLADIESALASGMLTDGPLAERLEEELAAHLGVDHCVAVSSCTAGLMLVVQALELEGPVALPSFTFSATAHAVRWNGLPIRFADCDPTTWCLAADAVPDDVAAIVGVHVSGVPCDVTGLTQRAAALGVPLVFDAAHGTGSAVTVDGVLRPLGSFGVAEVFSLTPTKVLNGAEGGIVATNDRELAARIRIARNYGNPGDYDTRFPGLNARLSELHAAVVLNGLPFLAERVDHRNGTAERYRKGMSQIPGVGFQGVREGDRSSWKDFTILIDETEFGCSRDAVVAALGAEGISTRMYYSPPVHRQHAYADVDTGALPVTDRLGRQVISLPMWSHLPGATADEIVEALDRIHRHADRIGAHPIGAGREGAV